jgi:hypothetical protein
MSFREGLLQARGQIIFIAALVCSTAVIVQLEYLDTTERIRQQVLAAASTTGEPMGSLSPELGEIAPAVINEGRDAYAADPGEPGARVAALNAAVLGLAHGVGQARQHMNSIEQVVSGLEAETGQDIGPVAPALLLTAAAVPDLEARIRALLARQ